MMTTTVGCSFFLGGGFLFLTRVMVEHIHCFPCTNTFLFHLGWYWMEPPLADAAAYKKQKHVFHSWIDINFSVPELTKTTARRTHSMSLLAKAEGWIGQNREIPACCYFTCLAISHNMTIYGYGHRKICSADTVLGEEVRKLERLIGGRWVERRRRIRLANERKGARAKKREGHGMVR